MKTASQLRDEFGMPQPRSPDDPPARPPLDPNLAPQVADADIERRADYLRRRLADGFLCGSMRRLTEIELREAGAALAERRTA